MSIAARKARTVVYVKELSLAILEEKSGESVICFTDESYVNVRHKIQFTWYSPWTPQGNEVGGPSGPGERIILLHAICNNGLIGEDISESEGSKDLSKSFPSAQHFFAGGFVGDQDYHKNMDGDLFINWIRNRFSPAFEAKFPGKKCILVMDNASYHSPKDSEFIKLGGNKSEIIASLKSLNVNSIQVERQGNIINYPDTTWGERKSSSAPSTSELLAALKIHVALNPQRQRSAVQKFFDSKGWQIIWTPPYTPQTQPIEKVWGYAKHFIASIFSPSRNLSVLLEDTLQAFYGEPPSDHPGVTTELCQKVISHTYRWCDDFINLHMHDGGNLSTLATHLQNNPDEEAVPVENDDQIDGAREEGENEIQDIFDFDYLSDDN